MMIILNRAYIITKNLIEDSRMYPEERLVPKIWEAPFTLADIVCCLKSWTVVDAGRGLQCSPTNGHREDVSGVEEAPGRSEQSQRIRSPKSNRRTPRARLG
jgi:hypothetical protein